MDAIASQTTSLTIVYSKVYSGADQRKHESSASLAFAWGSHRGPVNSPHKWPVTRIMFPFDDVIILNATISCSKILSLSGQSIIAKSASFEVFKQCFVCFRTFHRVRQRWRNLNRIQHKCRWNVGQVFVICIQSFCYSFSSPNTR